MMGITLKVSSDIVAGVLGLLLAAASYTISSFAYPRLIGKSASEAVKSGKTIEASVRSINSIRNWLGFWAISLSTLAHLLAFCLEFGILGSSDSVVDERSAVVLGGGLRFSNNHTADGILFMLYGGELPVLFTAAVRACAHLDTSAEDFKMIKNHFPAIDVSQNSSGTYVSDFDSFECTSSWLGSAVWTIPSAATLIIDLDTVTEQYRYENVSWTYGDGLAYIDTDLVSISYGFGTSYRGETLPVVLLKQSTSSEFRGTGISISMENGHYVYSLSETLDYSSIDGTAVLNGTFMRGHYRSSEYSLGGLLSVALTASFFTGGVLSEMHEASDTWWRSETTHGDYLVHSNPKGSEQTWPSLSDASGTVYTEYAKGTEPVQYPFIVGETEVTVVSAWCLALGLVLALIVVALTVTSLLLGEAAGDGFWTYDGLSRMVGSQNKPKSLAVIGIVGGEGSARIGLVRSED